MMHWKTVKTVMWSAVGGALVWWIVLGVVFGWMPAGSAEKRAVARAKTAVLDVLAPICVAQFNQDTEKQQKLDVMRKKSSWEHDDFVAKAGWATMPGSEYPEARITQTCANQILAANRS